MKFMWYICLTVLCFNYRGNFDVRFVHHNFQCLERNAEQVKETINTSNTSNADIDPQMHVMNPIKPNALDMKNAINTSNAAKAQNRQTS